MKKITTLIFGICLLLSIKIYSQISFTSEKVITDYGEPTSSLLVLPMINSDYNLDGFDDIILNKGKRLFVLENDNGERMLSETQIYESDQYIEDVSNFIDYNDDGAQDFIISTTDSIIVIVNMSGSYIKASSTIKPNTTYFTNLELFDFNNNGEIVLLCSTPNQILINTNWKSDISNFEELLILDHMNLMEEYIINFKLYKNNSKTGIVIETNLHDYFFHGNDGNLKLIGKMSLGFRSVFDFGDINLDGYTDIIISKEGEIFSLEYDYSNDTLIVVDQTSEDIYKNCYYASLIDIDENGSLDLVYRKFNDLVLRKNNGSGAFNDAIQLTSLTPSNLPQENLKFDFNNDGKQDLIQGGFGVFDLICIKSEFNIQVQSDWYSVAFRDVKCADLDGDTYEDIIGFNSNGSVEIIWGDINQLYLDRTEIEVPYGTVHGFVKDVDEDGISDILLITHLWNNVSSMQLVKGLGERIFADAIEWKSLGGVSRFVPIDSDNDGKEEFLIFNKYGSNICRYYPGNNDLDEFYLNPSSNINTSVSSITDIVVTEINNDVFPDIVVSSSSSKKLGFLLNDQSDGFTETVMEFEEEILGVESIDYNFDGSKDLLIIIKFDYWDYELQVLLNDGQNGFEIGTTYELKEIFEPNIISKIDLDNDTDLDIIISSFESKICNIFERDTNLDTMFYKGDFNINVDNQRSRTYVDINNDNLIDLIEAYYIPGNIGIVLNNSVLEPSPPNVTIFMDTILYNSAILALNGLMTSGSMVIAKEGSGTSFVPEDGNFYTHNKEFGIGSNVEENSFVIYSGSDTTIEVDNLKSNTTYEISVFEYNSNFPENTIINYSSEAVTASFKTGKALFSLQDFPDTIKINEDSVLTLDLTEYINDFGENNYDLTNQNAEITVSLSGTSLTVTPNKDYYGMDSISVLASLPTESLQIGFYLKILPVNDPPVIQDIDPVVINTDAPGETEVVIVPYEDPDTEKENLRIEVTSSNQDVVSYDGIQVSVNDGELLIEYNSKGYGISVITIKIIDENGEETIMTFNLEVSKITGISGFVSKAIIYPNPTTGIVYINSDLLLNLKSAILLNTLGVTIMSDLNLRTGEIDLSRINNGIYFLKADHFLFKIIKE